MPDGRAVLVLAGTALAISAALTEVLRRLCLRWGVLDRPANDRWHQVPRPRLGGAAAGTVTAHLEKLIDEGRVLRRDARFALV